MERPYVREAFTQPRLKSTLRLIAVAVFAAASLSLGAQDLSTEVVVDRTIVTTLPAVSPLSSMQPVSALTDRTPAAPEPTDYTMPADIAAIVGAANTPLFGGPMPVHASRGYVSLGYFPAYRLAAAAGYKILDSRADKLRVTASFNGESHHSPVMNGNKATIASNDFGVGAAYAHAFTSGVVAQASATYAHTALKRIDNYFTGTTSGNGIDRAGIDLSVGRAGAVNWSASAWLHHFGIGDIRDSFEQINSPTGYGTQDLPGASEQLFGLAARVSANDKSRFGAGLRAEFRHSTSPVVMTDGKLGLLSHSTEGIIGLNPAYDLTLSGIALRIGMHIDAGIGASGATVRIAPDVSALWHPIERAAVYASFTGGKRFNTLDEQFSYSAWAPSFAVAPTRYTPVDARVGIRLGSFGGFTADLHGGYAATRGAMRPSILYMTPVNVSGWTAGIEMSYRGYLPVELRFAADCYAAGSVSSGFADVPDGAKATLDASAIWHVNSAIDVRATYSLRACRRYVIFDYEANIFGNSDTRSAADYFDPYAPIRSSGDLGNVSDLGLRADWRVTEKLSTFAQVDNLLCRRYYLLPFIASPRIHGMIGATLRFESYFVSVAKSQAEAPRPTCNIL